jgi:hypothetical protein
VRDRRRGTGLGLGLLVWLGLLGVLAPVAFAAAPEAPETKPVTGVSSSTAVLHGVLNPHTVGKAGWYFGYGTGLGCVGASSTGLEPEMEGKALPEQFEVTSLEPDRSYVACLIASNGEGETPSPEVSFKTLAVPPSVEGESVSAVNSTQATLDASVNPNNQETTYAFEYATNEALTGATVVAGTEPLAAQYSPGLAVSVPTGVLTAGTTYFYRVVATNATPPASEGPVQSFTTVPTPNTDPASEIKSRTALFNGHLLLNAVETSFSFDYNTTGECTGGSSTMIATAGIGATSTPVSSEATELVPNTLYTVCMITTNAFGSETGAPVTFKTPIAAPTISAESTTEVTGTSAKLTAEVNPGGEETTYHFEYDITPYTSPEAHGTLTPKTPLLASDNTLHPANTTITGLTTGTTYHYRLVAENAAGVEDGPDTTLTTQTPGGPLALPDERQYQLVSPPEKDGAQVFGIVAEDGVVIGGSAAVQASENGNSITYLTSAPIGEPAGNAAATQVLSRRSTSGWSSQDISPPHKEPAKLHYENGEPFRLFSNALSQGALQENVNVSTQSAIALRDNNTGTSQTLDTSSLPQPVEFEDATPDFTDLILNTSGRGSNGVYEWSNGIATQVNILEDNEPAPSGFFGGTKLHAGEHEGPSEFAGRRAVSDDGSRVVWGTETQLFSRDMLTGETAQLDVGPVGSGGGVFQLASSDGTRVFFTDEAPLTPVAAPNSLYMFDIPMRQLTDLGPVGILHAEGPHNVPRLGDEVLGANNAGTAVYVTSEETLTEAANTGGEKAVAGDGNIFLLREAPTGSGTWSVSFIATLTTSDEAGYDPHPGSPEPQHLADLPVRVSEDGEYFAFMTDRSLLFTSTHGLLRYDNRDANSGVADEEVFLYSAASRGLVCASCDPTGARPVGELDTGEYPGLPMDPNRTWGPAPFEREETQEGRGPRGHWLAATIPPWNEALHVVYAGNGPFELPVYLSRVLSGSGRLFFDSADGLVSQDVNGREDVYEFEPGGLGSCPGSAGGSGCVALISSGQGAGDSDFVDASVSGGDVFFTTGQQLVPADRDPAADMYDAHVCSAGAPCLPASPVASPPCDSTDSCSPAQALQPGVFGAPASATFSGAGNIVPVRVVVPKPSPAQVRARELAREMRSCRKKRGHKRAVCEARARKRHGPKNAKSAKVRTGGAGRGVAVNGTRRGL